MKARAAVTDGQGRFAIREIEIAAPGPDEVLVEIKASGVCHTDWDSLNWKREMILGHEGAGIVLGTGPGVENVRAGDRVVLNWAIPCGGCFQCARDAENLCEKRGGVLDGETLGARYWLERNRALLPPLRFDCGRADPLLAANRQLHGELLATGIVHEYDEFEGGHAWPYWQEHLADTLLFFERQCTSLP